MKLLTMQFLSHASVINMERVSRPDAVIPIYAKEELLAAALCFHFDNNV
jgi:hypothetical protein